MRESEREGRGERVAMTGDWVRGKMKECDIRAKAVEGHDY